MRSQIDQMPMEVATALLTSNQSMSNTFKKRCRQARERVAEPVSRSTQLAISAPKTDEQRLSAKLRKASAAQLQNWLKRVQRVGNRLQDSIFEAGMAATDAKLLEEALARHDAIGQAIFSELTTRVNRVKLKEKSI